MLQHLKDYLVLVVLAFIAPPLVAQTPLPLLSRQNADGKSVSETAKVAVKKTGGKTEEVADKNFKSLLPLYGVSDRHAYAEYVTKTGKTPDLFPKPVIKSPYAPEDDTRYTYTGYNVAAGLAADGTTQISGMVNFNLDPFACDTVASDERFTPYSYMHDGKVYCFAPVYDASQMSYSKLIRSVYDANTLEELGSSTVSVSGGAKDRIPYLISYDDKRDVVWVISLGSDGPEGNGDAYYLNLLDTASCKLQRVGYLGAWLSERSKGNFNPKGFAATGGVLRVLNSDGGIYIQEIDPLTLGIKTIGKADISGGDNAYGLQPMVYDENSGKLTVNFFSLYTGTSYYSVSPFPAYGAKDDILKTELIENTPTGFTWFYKRPEAETQYTAKRLASISDLNVAVPDGGNLASITFTVPTVDSEGNAIEFPSYASKNLRCYVYVDNTQITPEGIPSSITYGDKLSLTTELSPGMHIVTVQLYPLYSEIGSVRTSGKVVSGYDAPADVKNPALSITGQKATITWQAPSEGRYSDFGSTFDASDITYTVMRNTDSTIVAKDIKETSVTDESLPEQIQTYSYTIYATSQGQTNNGTKTNSVSAGLYAQLPYFNDFSSSGSIDAFTILNLNNDGSYRTWQYGSYSRSVFLPDGFADDWFITPSFALKSDSLYAFQYILEGSGHLRTTVGKGNTPDAQTEVLDEVTGYTAIDNDLRAFYFLPSEDGKYNFALYSDNSGYLAVDNFVIKAIASYDAPDKVRGLNFTPEAKGALGGTLTFKLPATTIKGDNISKITKVTVYDANGADVGSLTSGINPGAEVSIKVTAVDGWNTYKVVASNDKGEGWPVQLRKYVGLDVPKPITKLNLTWGEERQIVNLSWDAPTEGVNGGYVDPSAYTYKIYKYSTDSYPFYTELGQTSGDTSVEVEIKDATETQDQYAFGITASTSKGESDYTRAGIVLGVPYTLPFDEPFKAEGTGVTHNPWVTMPVKNGQTWVVEQGFFNYKIQPVDNDGLQLLLRNTGSSDGEGRIITPIIDFSKAENPVLSVWLHHSDAMPENAYVTVDATVDGSSFIAASDTVRLTGNNGWAEHVFDLYSLKGKNAQVALDAYLPDPSVRVFADNLSIREASGNDLALSAISQPYMPVVGDTANITVTVENKGVKTASGYSVMFYLNGEVVDEKEADKDLALGKSAQFDFTLPISAGMKEIVYSAELVYEGDENADNNVSTEVELFPRQIDLPVPTELSENGGLLTWTAPEIPEGRNVKLDFDDVPAFTADKINGWTTFDGDGHLTTTFVQLYNNYWPYANQPFAWMTWSPKEAGCPTAQAWQPYSGDKCLIHFGNYGADATGRPNNDPDDDWFISPEIKGGTDFSLMTAANDVSCSIEILTSSTDNKPESFTNRLTTVNYESTATWKEISVKLPDDARYVAIHTVLDGFGIMIDDINYVEAASPVLNGYNVYCNRTAQSYVLKAESAISGNGDYQVSAVYNLGESALSDAVSVTTGINDATLDDVKVAGGKGIINISNADGESFSVYSAGGVLVSSGVAGHTETVNVPSGMYIVKVGGGATKVMVK